MFKFVRQKLFGSVRRLARDEDGASAVEFALVAAPFIGMLFAVIETAIVFFAGQVLEAAAADSSRLILTGQAQQQGLSQATFKTQVCNRIVSLFNCADGVYVDVKTYNSFGAINNNNPVSNGQLDKSGFAYQPGGPCSIVVMKLYYEWPVIVSIFGDGLSNLNGSKRLLVATSAFRNEPYGPC